MPKTSRHASGFLATLGIGSTTGGVIGEEVEQGQNSTVQRPNRYANGPRNLVTVPGMILEKPVLENLLPEKLAPE
jgi:hypothetical protein